MGSTQSILVISILLMSANYIFAKEQKYLQLIDKLDRPIDGYCLDVVGSGPNIRFDMPQTFS